VCEGVVDSEELRGGDFLGRDPFGKGDLDGSWAPEAVCSSSTAAKRSLGKRSATRTRAGHRRRWMSVTFPFTSRVAITSGRVENTAEHREDFVAGRVSPPAAADGFTGDVFGKIGHRAAC